MGGLVRSFWYWMRWLGIFNPKAYGAKGDGGSDDTQAILDAVQDWVNYGTTGGTLRMTNGTYMVSSPIDFSQYITESVSYKSIVMDAGVQIAASKQLSEVINLAPAEGQQFLSCEFKFGCINANNYNTQGIRIRGVNDCKIEVERIVNSANTGFIVDESSTPATPTQGCFNNIIEISNIIDCTTAFATNGINGNSYGFQGNLVTIAHVYGSTNGINIDAAGYANSTWNTFNIGVVEHCSGAGIIDNNGANTWNIANMNTNGTDFVLGSSAVGVPKVEGIWNTINLNGKIARMNNLNKMTGNQSTIPNVPASGTAQTNPYQNQAMVCIFGGTVQTIAIGGIATGLTSGAFLLNVNETVTLNYTSAPNWTWFTL